MSKKTISILAVAFTASTAACGGATDTTVGTPGQHQSAARGETATGADEGAKQEESATAPAPTPSGSEEPSPGGSAPAACDLTKLSEELASMTTDVAVTKHEHFRCLCDDKGYPLVGNINSKGATASSFCAAITEKGLL